MAILKTPRRIRAEDFPKEQQDLVSKLSDSLNDFYDDITYILNGRVDFANLNRQIITIVVETNSTTGLKTALNVKVTLKSKLIGINVINTENLTDPTAYPTGGVTSVFTFDSGIVSIKNITGLQASSKYRLTLELIGN